MSLATWWWIAAGAAVALELATGTFYLLMFALGMAAAAIVAHAGGAIAGQIAAAALIGGGAVAAWHLWRGRAPKPLPPATNPDVNLDIGQRVQVTEWSEGGSARVVYRGATWAARYQGADAPTPGEYRIAAVVGNELQLDR